MGNETSSDLVKVDQKNEQELAMRNRYMNPSARTVLVIDVVHRGIQRRRQSCRQKLIKKNTKYFFFYFYHSYELKYGCKYFHISG